MRVRPRVFQKSILNYMYLLRQRREWCRSIYVDNRDRMFGSLSYTYILILYVRTVKRRISSQLSYAWILSKHMKVGRILKSITRKACLCHPCIESTDSLILFHIPCNNSTPYRAFSSLHLIKTYLRSMTTSQQLNNLFLLYVHKHLTDSFVIVSSANTRHQMLPQENMSVLKYDHVNSVTSVFTVCTAVVSGVSNVPSACCAKCAQLYYSVSAMSCARPG